MQINREAMTEIVRARLDATSDKTRRRNLTTLLTHMRGEIAADVDLLVSTVAEAVSYHTWGQPDRSPAGRADVRAFYKQLAAEGYLYFEFDIERLLVDDDMIVTEGVMTSLIPSQSLGAYGVQAEGGVHMLVTRMAIFWPFDDQGLLLGEDTYSSFIEIRAVKSDEVPTDYPYAVSA